jgi:PKD repeat protein
MEHSFNFFISVPSILLLVVAFSLALVGTVAAAEDSYAVRNISQAYVIPYGYLPSGTPVTSGFSLNVIGVYPSGGEEDFFTDLVQPNWSYTIVVNGVENIRPVVSGSSFAISGFELCYRPSDVVTVSVMVEGEAPVVDSPLKNFTVIKAQSLFGNGTVIPGSVVTVERQTAATQPPVTDFTAHPTSGAPPLTVSFWDASVNYPSSWNWSFGDGTWFNFSGLVPLNPIHSYSGYGTYTVTLTTSNAIGTSTTTKSDFITVTNTRVGVFRPSAHTFYLKNGTTTAINWGISTDLPVTGDWNGDGRTDVGVYRPSAHTFYLKNGTTTAINWGASTDLPVTGDWNADGITDVGVFRPSTHMFYLKNGTTTWTTTAINWGASTDLPVTGDWNADGITDVGVFRPSTHMFYLKNGTALSWSTTAINWGVSTDLPVTGDWNWYGSTDVGVFRPSTHMFYLRNPDYPAIPVKVINWGLSSDLPVTGTWADAPVPVQPQVTITFNQNLTITPGTTTFIPVGGKVIWKNEDSLKPHGLKAVDTSGSDYFGGQTGIVIPFGKPYEVTFETDGSFNYTTTWEPEVPGSVIVT